MPTWGILLDILIMLGAALLLGTLAEQVRQSAILGYLVAGTLVGPNVLGLVGDAGAVATGAADGSGGGGADVQSIAELGVALLLFTLGLEFSFRRLRQLGRVALLGGGLQILLTMAAGAGVAVAFFGLDLPVALAVGAMMALSSTACVARLLIDRAAIDTLYGRNALGILLMQDVAVIPLVLMVVALSTGGTATEAILGVGRTVLVALVLVAAFIILFNYVVPRVLNMDRWARNRELPILFAVVVALGSAYAAHAAGVSAAMGAFAAGVLLGESPFAVQIRADVAALRTLLMTLFFASIGTLGDPVWVMENWLLVGGVLLLIMVGKVLVTWGVVFSVGFPVGVALATAMSLAQVGEFSFVLATTAFGGELIGTHLFKLIVSTTIATLFLTPFFIAAAPRARDLIERLRRDKPWPPASPKTGRSAAIADRDDRPALERPEPREVLLVGFGPAGQALSTALHRRHKQSLRVIELSSRRAQVAARLGLDVHIGDARHADVLEHAGASAAKVIAVAVPDGTTVRAIIQQCRQLAPEAAIVARSRYSVQRHDIEAAGAAEVVDEERQVGQRMAAAVRRSLRGRDARRRRDGEQPGERG